MALRLAALTAATALRLRAGRDGWMIRGVKLAKLHSQIGKVREETIDF